MDEQDFVQFITVKKGLSKESIRLCATKFKLIAKWLKENSKELNKETIEEFFFYLRQIGRNNNTLNTYYFTLRYIQDYLQDRGRPIQLLDGMQAFTKVKPLIIILTPDEVERVVNTPLSYGKWAKFSAEEVTNKLGFMYQTVTMFLAYTGCRFGEAASLKVKLLDLEAGKATFIETKNKEIRHAHITEPLISRLRKLTEGKEPEDLVFTSMKGSKMHPQDFITDLKKRAKKAGITKRVHPHLFRHSFGTQLIMSGVDITMVASILGHKDIQTTYDNYVHLADETLKKATYRHPLIRKNIDPKEILKNIKEQIESFRLETDARFNYRTEEGSNSLSFTVFIK